MITVLMIDDNLEHLESWANGLGACSTDYVILKAESVKEGLDLCQLRKIDCVVLDLDLGVSSGFEVLLALIPDHTRPEKAVVILSRLLNPTVRAMAIANGAHAYLLKRSSTAHDLDVAIRKAVVSVGTAS